jgi:hypothetical protein
MTSARDYRCARAAERQALEQHERPQPHSHRFYQDWTTIANSCVGDERPQSPAGRCATLSGHGAVRRLLDVPQADSARVEVLALLGVDLQFGADQADVLLRLLLGRAPADGATSQRLGD